MSPSHVQTVETNHKAGYKLESNQSTVDNTLSQFLDSQLITLNQVHEKSSSHTTQSTHINPQTVESIWGLLTHHIDGLTSEQIAALMNQHRQQLVKRVDTLTAQHIEDI